MIMIMPLIFFVALIIIVFDRQNPFYFETRSGLYGKPFKIIKLRTMKFSSKDKNKIVTNLGKYIRKSKIDELPQIFNVLFGQMSLVGPRPLYLEYNSKYSKYEKLRLNNKPGITGLAQIKVLNRENWRAKFRYDIFYVKNRSLKLDLYIICKTFAFYLDLIVGRKVILESHKKFKE